MIALQLRRMIRWQKLQRFRASPRFAYRAAEAKALRDYWCANMRRDNGWSYLWDL
jgi:hypothetical protein